MFSNAKKLPTVPAPAKGKGPPKNVEALPGLAEVAALDACAKAIKGLLDMKKAALKETATEILIERGLERHSRPDTLRVAEGEYATGRATMTKRSTASPLSSDELAVLAEMLPGVQVDDDGNITAIDGFVETLEAVPAKLAVNPAYQDDEALLKKIDKALSGVKGIPQDFIGWTEAKAKVVVSDTAPDQVFKLNAEMAATVFPLISGVSLGTVFQDVSKAWDIVKPMIAPDAKQALGKMLRASLAKDDV